MVANAGKSEADAPTPPTRKWMARPSFRREHVLLAVLLLFFLGLKAVPSPGLRRGTTDGSFYYQIARHVAQGDGLQTSVSLWHQGLKELPHKTNQTPVWPLVLGFAGRLISLEAASIILPKLLYLLSLVLLYFVANRVAFELSGGDSGSSPLGSSGFVDYGHVAILLFGLNPVFFWSTSLPYSEGLAFVLFLGAVAMTVRAIETNAPILGLLAGSAAMLSLMTRIQFLGAPMTILLALFMCALRDRRLLRVLLAATAGSTVCLGAWIAFLASWVKPFHPRVLLALSAYRETPELLPYPMVVEADSAIELWMNRLSGLATAFDPRDSNSYLESFGVVALLVPLAGAMALGRHSPATWVRQFLRPNLPMTWLLVVGGVVLVLPTHVSQFVAPFREWLFGHRHGLPLMFLIVVAVPFLVLTQIRAIRWFVGAMVLSSLLLGSVVIAPRLSGQGQGGLGESEQELVRWLDRDPQTPSVAITTHPQLLGAFSVSVFHSIKCDEPSSQTRTLLNKTSAEFVVIFPGEQECLSLRDLLPDLEMVRSFETPPIEREPGVASAIEVFRARW